MVESEIGVGSTFAVGLEPDGSPGRVPWLSRDHARPTCTILHRMSGTIVAIATHKGGVGKTVITMAMSAAFARAGQPALVVDMDPQGHASIGLGVEVLDNELTLRDFFLDAATPIDKSSCRRQRPARRPGPRSRSHPHRRRHPKMPAGRGRPGDFSRMS